MWNPLPMIKFASFLAGNSQETANCSWFDRETFLEQRILLKLLKAMDDSTTLTCYELNSFDQICEQLILKVFCMI